MYYLLNILICTYIIACTSNALYNLPFNLIGIILSHKIPDTYFYFIYPHLIPYFICSSKSPFFYKTDHNYLNITITTHFNCLPIKIVYLHIILFIYSIFHGENDLFIHFLQDCYQNFKVTQLSCYLSKETKKKN